MVRRCWVNFQCRGVLLIWIIVGQGPIALAVGAGGVVWTFFSLIYHFSFLSPSLWETARYRLKYCLKGPLSPKQPTNQKDISQYFTIWFVLLFYVSITKPNSLYHSNISKVFMFLQKKKKYFLISRSFLFYNTLPHVCGGVLCSYVGHPFVCPYVCLSIHSLFPFHNI